LTARGSGARVGGMEDSADPMTEKYDEGSRLEQDEKVSLARLLDGQYKIERHQPDGSEREIGADEI
jgi:hypothetical protein